MLYLGLKKNVLFPISSPVCHRVGRLATFFFSLFLLYQVRLWWVNPNFFFLMESENILTSLTEHLTVFDYRDVAARFETNCTNMLGLACKSVAILEINKRTMKTDNDQKLVRKNYVPNVYKNRDCLGSVADFFFSSCAKKNYSRHIFLTVGGEIGNITFFFRPY